MIPYKQVAIGVVVLTLTAIAFIAARSAADKPFAAVQELPAGTSNNVEALRASGHPIPQVDEWWIPSPTPQQVADQLIPPAESEETICIKRLWIPREIKPQVNVDDSLLALIERAPTGPHQSALLSHYHQAAGREASADQQMQAARQAFFADPWTGRVYCNFRSRELLSALFALDWIRWDNASEFEKAFDRVRRMIIGDAPANHVLQSEFIRQNAGYWNADSNIEHPNYVESLLVLCVHGVNVNGESHRWASDRLKHLGSSATTDPQVMYSPFKFSNVISMLSRRGGGREYGQQFNGPGPGGYEEYFATSAMIQLEATDTATGRHWKLREKNLYMNTRWIGLITEIDDTVSRAYPSANILAALRVFAKFFRDDPNKGGRYQWATQRYPEVQHLREFQAMAGPAPEAVPPEAKPMFGRIASRWHYREDPTQPNSTFRMWITNRDIEHFRISPDERCLYFAVGNVGLVDGQSNRAAPRGAISNGVFIAKVNNGEPELVLNTKFSMISTTHHPYWSGDRVRDADPLLNDPRYLVGLEGPKKEGDTWTWTRDYTNQISRDRNVGYNTSVTTAKAEYTFDPKRRRLEIIDTLEVDPSLYVGWHFSPTHRASVDETGFVVSDGQDSVQVTMTGMDGTQLLRERRDAWSVGGQPHQLEWHQINPPRIAENIAYVPYAASGEYKVKVTIQANPDNAL